MVLGAGKAPQAAVVSRCSHCWQSRWTYCYCSRNGVKVTTTNVLPSTFRLLFHHNIWCCRKVEGFEVPLIKQPPVNPLENEMVLELVKRHTHTVVAAECSHCWQSTGLIVWFYKRELYDHNVCCVHVFSLQFHTRIWCCRKLERFEVPLINRLLIH
jgi:hypothetical protein